MTVHVDAKELSSAIAHVAAAVPGRPASPAYSGIPLVVTDGEMHLTGFNGETMLRQARIAAGGSMPHVLAHGGVLARLAARLTGDVRLDEDGRTLKLSGGRASFEVPIMPDIYPRTPGMPPALGQAVGLGEALPYVLGSVATLDEDNAALAALACVHMTGVDGVLRLLATDRYRLSRVLLPWDGPDFDVLVSGKPLGDAVKALGGAVTIHADESHFGASTSRLSISLSTTDAVFPPSADPMFERARALALSDDGGVLIASKELLLNALKDVHASLDNFDPLVLDLSMEGGVTISGRGTKSDGSGRILLSPDDAFYSGPDYRVKVQAFLLESAVHGTPAPYIALGVGGPLKPLHVAGQATEEAEEVETRVQHVVMPLRDLS